MLKQHCFVWNVFAFVLGNENVTQCPVLKYINTALFGNAAYTKRSIAYAVSYTALFLGDLQPVLKPSSLEPCDSLVKAEHIISVLRAGQ